jgi:hypothetical protein
MTHQDFNMTPRRRVLRWDPWLNPDGNAMEFKLTYAGPLLAHKDTGATRERLRQRSLHVHTMRKIFHGQLKTLWSEHPVLQQISKDGSSVELYVGSGAPPLNQIFQEEGFNWLPMVTKANGLICKVDVLMLRHGQPGNALYDVDNRLKTLFDALRKADGPDELGASTAHGKLAPEADEDPFYVVMQDDKLITHLSVTTDTLLEPVPNVLCEQAVRLVIDITIRPYRAFAETAGYA